MCSTRRVLLYCLDLYVCMFVLLLLSGAFAELQKPSISFDSSFRLPEWNNSVPSGRMYEIWYLSMFGNAVEKTSSLIKIGEEYGVLYLKITRYF